MSRVPWCILIIVAIGTVLLAHYQEVSIPVVVLTSVCVDAVGVIQR